MHLDQMLLVLDLARTHSFNQTAERHYTTQQNVSYSVKQLEKELNVKIFNRSKNGVTFTDEGEQVLRCARQMNEAYQQLLQALGQRSDAEEIPQRLELYFSSVLLTDHMPHIIAAFSDAWPNTRLFLREAADEDIVPALLSGGCDMAVWSVNQRYLEQVLSPQKADLLDFHVIRKDHSIAVVSADSSLAKKTTLTMEELNSASKSIFGLLPMDYFGKNVNQYVQYQDDNPSIHQQLMRNENTICFTSEIMYRQFFPKDKFVAIPFDYPVLPNYHMILRKKDSRHAVYDTLDETIFAQLRNG